MADNPEELQVNEELVEAAIMRVLKRLHLTSEYAYDLTHAAREIRCAVLAIADPIIRADEREECAKVAEAEEELEGDPPPELAFCERELRAAVQVTKRNIAQAIRNRP